MTTFCYLERPWLQTLTVLSGFQVSVPSGRVIHCVSTWCYLLSGELFERVGYTLASGYAIDQEKVRDYIEQPWLQVTDNLVALRHGDSWLSIKSGNVDSSYKDRLVMWRKFGSEVGLDEDGLRQARARTQKATMGGLVGCSWIRCPLHEVDGGLVGRELMACTRCYSVRPLPPESSSFIPHPPRRRRPNTAAFSAKRGTYSRSRLSFQVRMLISSCRTGTGRMGAINKTATLSYGQSKTTL